MKTTNSRSTLFVAGVIALAAAAACSAAPSEANDASQSGATEGEGAGAADPAAVASALPDAPALVPAATLARYKAALPKVGWPALQALLASPATLWFDKEAMIPSYQDSVGDGAGTPIGARANSAGRPIIVPEGKPLFADDGKTWSFPFAHTAGTDRSTNALVVNFLALPEQAGKRLPVVYRTIDDPGGFGGLGIHKWTWTYPKGTTIGEVIFLRDAGGELYCAELRTRTRWLAGWSVNVYRPFPTAASLAAAIKTARPDWQTRAGLAAAVAHLDNPATLTPKSFASPAWKDVFTASGYLDVVPDLGDEALVKELLRKTTFVSSYGEAWKTNGAQRAFAASSEAAFSFVPNGYEAGVLEVNEVSCARCHKDAGRPINDFVDAAVLYGDVWGEDQIFSFHPYDQSRYPEFNTDNRRVRPELLSAGIVELYDATKHPDTIYKPVPR